MRRIIVSICLVALMMVGSVAFADQEQCQAQEQEQGQVQGQTSISTGNVQGQESASTGNVTIIKSNFEEKTGVVSVPIPGLPWMVPPTSNLWNTLPIEETLPNVLENVDWTMEKVMKPLKHTGKLFAEKGSGFDKIASFIEDYPATRSIAFRNRITLDELNKNYHFIGVINLKADKDLTYFLGLMYGMKIAMEKGGDLAVLSGGMNSIYHTSSAGIGFAPAFSNRDSSFSMGGGVNSGNAKSEGESSVKLAVFKKNGVKEVAEAPTVPQTVGGIETASEAKEAAKGAEASEKVLSEQVNSEVVISASK